MATPYLKAVPCLPMPKTTRASSILRLLLYVINPFQSPTQKRRKKNEKKQADAFFGDV